MSWLNVQRGSAPLLLSLPHTGTQIPHEIGDRLVSADLALTDTDWWIDKLYAFAADLDATLVRTAISRTVIDVNRDPSGMSLYPGQATTGLCPTTTFAGEPLYAKGREPDEEEIARRRTTWFEPYHVMLTGEIARLLDRHERIVVYDCHSIRSVVPRLFDGELPVFNIGTSDGTSCARQLQEIVERACSQSGQPWVANGRFKGGWITRNYGNPAGGVHALQMELGCRIYMDESPDSKPAAYSDERAEPALSVLKPLIEELRDWA